MNILIRILITAVLVIIISHFMHGVVLDDGLKTSFVVAVVLGLLNLIVKPILVLFTLPVTILTLGLFLLVINAAIILICTKLVNGFHVDSFWTALVFSIILSISQSILYRLTKESKKK